MFDIVAALVLDYNEVSHMEFYRDVFPVGSASFNHSCQPLSMTRSTRTCYSFSDW